MLALSLSLLLALVPAGVAAPGDAEPSAEVFADSVRIDPGGKRDDYEVQPVGKNGLVLIGSEAKGREWSFARYDTDFQKVWEVDHDLGGKSVLRDRAVTEDALWLLIDTKRKSFLLGVDVATGQVRPLEVETTGNIKLTTQLVVNGDFAYVIGVSKNAGLLAGNKGDLIKVNLGSGSAARLSAGEATGEKKVLLQRLAPSSEGADLVAMSHRKKRITLHILAATPSGIEEAVRLDPGEDHNLLTAQRVVADGQTMVFGTYAAKERALMAQGMYVTRLEDGMERVRTLHSFTDFDSFFDYLRDKKQDKVQKKIDKKKARGKDLRLNYLLNVHDIVKQGDRWLVVAEAFYPEYQTHTRTVTSTDANGNTVTRVETYQVFVGFRYTHAVVAAFDDDGQRVWDASFPIKNILSRVIRDRVKVRVDGDRIEMVYAYGGRLYSRVATADGLREDKQTHEEADLKRGWASDAEYWYDDHFVMWGYQKVKGGGGGKRKVFSFSKVDIAEASD